MPCDLTAYTLTLANDHGPLPLTAVRAHALNGFFYTCIAPSLHPEDKPGVPLPFSLTPLAEGGHLTGLRIAALNAATAEAVGAGVGMVLARGDVLRLGPARVRLTGFAVEFQIDYAQILAQALPLPTMTLAFDTPLRLRRDGRFTVLPVPGVLWRYYAARWRTYAPHLPLPEGLLEWVEQDVLVTRADLRPTQTLLQGDERWEGQTGWAEYQASAAAPVELLRAWQALAALAEFCGSGEKTTMGLGRTRKRA